MKENFLKKYSTSTYRPMPNPCPQPQIEIVSPSNIISDTKEDIVRLIQSLPPKPDEKFLKDWNVFVSPKAKVRTNSTKFWHKETKLRVRFDPAKEGAVGFNGKDHWHVYNPNANGKKDLYLDKDGNPTPRGSRESHILPKNKR